LDLLEFEHLEQQLREAEKDNFESMHDAFSSLRPLGLEDFGLILWNMPSKKYPRLSSLLPPMASDGVQAQWTGSAGAPLLLQSLNFVRACAASYAKIANEDLSEKRILDFGCGYGRFLRLFSFYSDFVYGLDSWDKSIEQCRLARFGEKVRLSDSVPSQLPFGGPFDFIFSFSVFTHLSERSSIACLDALRCVVEKGALMMITVRPPEFWSIASQGRTHLPVNYEKISRMERCRVEHKARGFAFYCDDPSSQSDYGDTSMSLDWLAGNAKGWMIVSVDRSLHDAFQRYVMLQAT